MQFDYPGTIGLPDGRYLSRRPAAEDAPPGPAGIEVAGGRAEPGAGGTEAGAGGREERVLVIATEGAPPPPRRRRMRARAVEPGSPPQPLPLTRATAIRAFEPFAEESEAERWLDAATDVGETADALIEEGMALLNRALHANAAASGDTHAPELTPRHAAAVRIGWGSGDQVAAGEFAAAREIDVRGGVPKRRRAEDLRPQERVAAVLGGREQIDACETLLLRARADLDAGRTREAALQLRVGLEALLVELREAVADPGHDEDMAILGERRGEAGEAANAALRGELDPVAEGEVEELLAICERVLRRRRVLRG